MASPPTTPHASYFRSLIGVGCVESGGTNREGRGRWGVRAQASDGKPDIDLLPPWLDQKSDHQKIEVALNFINDIPLIAKI